MSMDSNIKMIHFSKKFRLDQSVSKVDEKTSVHGIYDRTCIWQCCVSESPLNSCLTCLTVRHLWNFSPSVKKRLLWSLRYVIINCTVKEKPVWIRIFGTCKHLLWLQEFCRFSSNSAGPAKAVIPRLQWANQKTLVIVPTVDTYDIFPSKRY